MAELGHRKDIAYIINLYQQSSTPSSDTNEVTHILKHYSSGLSLDIIIQSDLCLQGWTSVLLRTRTTACFWIYMFTGTDTLATT